MTRVYRRRTRPQRSRLPLCVALAAAALPLAAPSPASSQAPEPQVLPRAEVVGVAHRAGRPLEDVAPTVSVLTRRDIETGLAFDLRDLLRYEPGLSIDNHPARFGLGNLAIRGIDGNRVVLMLDGIRLAESYRVGSFSNATREAIDLGLLRKVEILRGPGSALYGSDALAGVVSFTTVDPADVLRDGASVGLAADVGATGVDDAVHRGFVFATRGARVGALVGYRRSDGHERTNEGGDASIGTSRTAANPQDRSAETWLGKLLYTTPTASYRLTLDRMRRGTDTDVRSLNPLSSRTARLDASDHAARERASVDVDAEGAGALARVRVLLYTQRTLTRNDTSDLRVDTTPACLSAIGTVSCLRDVRFRYEQQERGATLLADVDRAGRWVLGLEYARIDTDERRDGTQTDLGTGTVSTVVGGEPMPTRDFPLSRTERIGAFAQNEIELPAADVTLIPALRYDRFRVTPEVDPVFASTNPGRTVTGLADSAVSPKFGVLWRAAPRTIVSANLATGFRAPPAADINIGLANVPSGYTVVPNPNLRSERSRGAELGVRTAIGPHRATATVFRTDYRDLIVSRAPLACPADPDCVPGATGTFQSINVSRARIEGFEATALARLAMPWSVRAAYTYARGDDRTRGAPLNTIEPQRLLLGLLYETRALEAGAHVTRAWRKTRIDQSTGPYAPAAGYTTLDLAATWTIDRRVRVSVGLFNALDRKYWLWADLRNAPRPGATVDRYTQPGRHASVLVRAEL